MEDPKLIIVLASIFVGWLLAQLTGTVKEWLKCRKIRKCLLEELEELQCELERVLMVYSRQLQIHALQGVDNSSPAQLSNHIFKNYYKDAVLSLNKNQRISMQLIHTLIESVNSGILSHTKITSDIQDKYTLKGKESITTEDGEYWGNKVISEFGNVAAAIWHIRFHLSNPKSPDLTPYTKDHENYLKYLESVENKISEMMNQAKSIPREQFEKIYDPAVFTRDIL
jgi:hypothetical protein